MTAWNHYWSVPLKNKCVKGEQVNDMRRFENPKLQNNLNKNVNNNNKAVKNLESCFCREKCLCDNHTRRTGPKILYTIAGKEIRNKLKIGKLNVHCCWKREEIKEKLEIIE